MGTAITVKNVPEALYGKLKKRAGRNRRSINSEIISIFEEALSVRPLKPEDMIATARALRGKTRNFTLDQDFIDQAKKEGRP
jgi:plasmid stability protein